MYRKTKKILDHFLNAKRNRLIALRYILIVFFIVQNLIFAQNVHPINLSWLEGKPPSMSTGVSWGVPLPEGIIKPSTSFSLKNTQGQAMPVQS